MGWEEKGKISFSSSRGGCGDVLVVGWQGGSTLQAEGWT